MTIFEFMQNNPLLTVALAVIVGAAVVLGIDCAASAFRREK